MTVERSLQHQNIPPVRRRTPWTKHYKRASSLISTSDIDSALKELEFKLAPEPLKAVTNCTSPSDNENRFAPGQLQKSSLFLPLMSESVDSDKSTVSLRPILKHTPERLRLQLSPSKRTESTEWTTPITPRPTMGIPAMPPTPRKSRKCFSYVELDLTDAPASIFMPEDL